MRGTLHYSNNDLFIEDQTVTSTGAYAGTMTLQTNRTYDAGIATFIASAGTSATTAVVPYRSLMGVGL